MGARRDAGLHFGHDLVEHERRLRLVVAFGRCVPLVHRLGDHVRDDGAHGRGAQHLLGLALELRLRQAHGQHRGQAGHHVVLLELVGADLEATGVLFDLGAQELEQARVEPGLVGAALGRGDDVDEAADDGVVAGPPAQRDVHVAVPHELGGNHRALVGEHGHRLGERAVAGQPPGIGDGRIRGEVVDELRNAALEAERLEDGLRGAPVGDVDGEPRHEERGLACPAQELLGLEGRALREDLAVGPVPDPGARLASGDLADNAQFALLLERRERRIRALLAGVGEDAGLAPVEGHGPGLAVAVDLDVEALRQGVDDGCAHPVQSAGGRVGAAAELAAGVQLGEDDLDAGEAGLGLDVHGDTAGGVAHLDALVGVQHDIDAGSVPAEGFVDRVVDDFPQAMHEAAGVGGPDIHAGPLAHRLESLENGKVPCGIVRTHNC